MPVIFIALLVAAGMYAMMWWGCNRKVEKAINLSREYFAIYSIAVVTFAVYSYFINPKNSPFFERFFGLSILFAPILNLFFLALGEVHRQRQFGSSPDSIQAVEMGESKSKDQEGCPEEGRRLDRAKRCRREPDPDPRRGA
ncbi:MAG: hypothetical protein ACKO81_10375 [Planctomycetota bacterium]